ncbi:hypothetical protein [Nesterenkonia xinjiangensis]|uniref:BMFP domain-containing protein YqiC n=1 Tax=Nesterenkonia xinjiangensis TaxID=225327 RepID=A0A7Z0GKP5_9MICC|nr:hypothetical protein [Nesterenkonia xinjiangensis]NYJ77513.1 BMFP domain-containing protein YqiC [Nesterenkonia xinjiangensis]
MPWFAWIVIAAIVVGGLIAVATVWSERGIGAPPDRDELQRLKRRIAELEEQQSAKQLEGPHIPTRAEENLTAEDRWRLDMLEARLESLEEKSTDDDDDPGEDGLSGGTTR